MLALLKNPADPSLDLNFLSGALDSRINFTRASSAFAFDATGTLQSFAANAPRLDHDPASLAPRGLLMEEQRTNSIRNPRCEGAVAGSPGTVPANWGASGTGSGIAQTVVGFGSESGIPYVDVQYSGTATANNISWLSFDSVGVSPATATLWSSSVYCRIVGGSIANLSYINLNHEEHNGTGGVGSSLYITSLLNSTPLSTQIYSLSHTIAGTGIQLINTLVLGYSTGAVINITLRIGAPQLEQGAFATSPILPAIGSPAATTRAFDFASMPLTVPQSGFTFAIEANSINAGLTGLGQALIGVLDGGETNGFRIFRGGIGSGVGMQGLGSLTNGAPGQNFTLGTPYKYAVTFSPATWASIINAASLQTLAVTGTLGTPTHLEIGYVQGNQSMNGYLRRIRCWPRALSAAELGVVTT